MFPVKWTSPFRVPSYTPVLDAGMGTGNRGWRGGRNSPAADGAFERDDFSRAGVRWALVPALVWAVSIEVPVMVRDFITSLDPVPYRRSRHHPLPGASGSPPNAGPPWSTSGRGRDRRSSRSRPVRS